jgi:hypothetical protein
VARITVFALLRLGVGSGLEKLKLLAPADTGVDFALAVELLQGLPVAGEVFRLDIRVGDGG